MSESILFVDCGNYKPLPPAEALFLVSQGLEVFSVTSIPAALQVMQHKKLDILVSNSPHLALFEDFRARSPQGLIFLATDLPMKDYSALLEGREETLIDHVIANKGGESWTIHQLRISFSKLATRDIFGIEKYLAPNTPIHRTAVKGSAERELLNQKVLAFAEACHLGQHGARMAYGISEELLMNTIFDAPHAAGIERFRLIDQTQAVILEPSEWGELSYGCDGQLFAISTSDPFGALRKQTLLKYLKKVLIRDEVNTGLIDEKRGGAGLGFFKILYSSHALVCNVAPGRKTELMALIDVNEPLRDFTSMTRSIHYFSAS